LQLICVLFYFLLLGHSDLVFFLDIVLMENKCVVNNFNNVNISQLYFPGDTTASICIDTKLI